MKYTKMASITAKVGASVNDFLIDAKIPPVISSKWKSEDVVPSYAAIMLFKFASKKTEQIKDQNRSELREDIFKTAKDLGYEILDDHISILLEAKSESEKSPMLLEGCAAEFAIFSVVKNENISKQ